MDNLIDGLDLFLNMIGGHSLLLKIDGGKLIKAVQKSEVNFYESFHIKENELKLNIFPKYFGSINIKDNPAEFNKINHFMKLADAAVLKILNQSISVKILRNIENLYKKYIISFNKKLNIFLEYKIELSIDEEEIVNNLVIKILALEESKLKWFIFWYINNIESKMKEYFIIIEDLTYSIKNPAILDLKLGLLKKLSKKDMKIKPNSNSQMELGFRIMGIQNIHKENFVSEFICRYECKHLLVNDIINEITKFFTVSNIKFKLDNSRLNFLIAEVITKLENLIGELNLINLYDIPAASLLIIYDVEDEKLTKIQIKIIDFSFYSQEIDTDITFNKKINVIVKNEKNIIWSLQNIVLFFKGLLKKES